MCNHELIDFLFLSFLLICAWRQRSTFGTWDLRYLRTNNQQQNLGQILCRYFHLLRRYNSGFPNFEMELMLQFSFFLEKNFSNKIRICRKSQRKISAKIWNYELIDFVYFYHFCLYARGPRSFFGTSINFWYIGSMAFSGE